MTSRYVRGVGRIDTGSNGVGKTALLVKWGRGGWSILVTSFLNGPLESFNCSEYLLSVKEGHSVLADLGQLGFFLTVKHLYL